MKPAIFLIALFVGLNSSSIAQVTERDSVTDAHITALIEAQVTNDISALRTLLAKNAVITIPAKSGEIQISRNEFLNMLKQSGREQQTCASSYIVIKRTENSLTAQLEMTYPAYTVLNTVRSRLVNGTWVVLALEKTLKDVTSSPVIVLQ